MFRDKCIENFKKCMVLALVAACNALLKCFQ